MIDERVDRRAFVAASCSSLAATWLSGLTPAVRVSLAHAVRARAMPEAHWEFFSPGQAAEVEAITAHIVPSDDTPGARDAGVVHFIDHSLAGWAAPQRTLMTEGLADLTRRVRAQWPGAEGFVALAGAAQIAMLHEIEGTPFFQGLRFATLAGMFALPSYGGNVDEAGWRLIGFESRHAWAPPFGYYDADARTRGDG